MIVTLSFYFSTSPCPVECELSIVWNFLSFFYRHSGTSWVLHQSGFCLNSRMHAFCGILHFFRLECKTEVRFFFLVWERREKKEEASEDAAANKTNVPGTNHGKSTIAILRYIPAVTAPCWCSVPFVWGFFFKSYVNCLFLQFVSVLSLVFYMPIE